MSVLLVYNLDSQNDDKPLCELSTGEHVIGRGPLLQCNDQRISRSHALIKIKNNEVTILPTHTNPCFYQSANSRTILILPKNETSISDGDKLGLLPDKFWFKMQITNNTIDNDDSIKCEEANSDDSVDLLEYSNINKRSYDDNDDEATSCKLTKIDNDLNAAKVAGQCDLEKTDCEENVSTISLTKNILDGEEVSCKQECTENDISNETGHNLENSMNENECSDNSINLLECMDHDDQLVSCEQNVSTTLLTKNILDNEQINIRVICTKSDNSNEISHNLDDAANENETSDNSIYLLENVDHTSQLVSPSESKDAYNTTGDMSLCKKEQQKDLLTELSKPVNSSEETVLEEDSKENNQNGTSESVGDNQQAQASATSTVYRDRCNYGASCYRKNPQHKQEFSHPGDPDYTSDSSDTRPLCVYGSNCYRKNKDHRAQYRHPRTNSTTQRTRRQRTTRLGLDDTPEDDYDYNDPFLDDGSEDEYNEESWSDSDSDWQNSENVDEEDTKSLLKEAKRFTKK